jgi:hypothetical protein
LVEEDKEDNEEMEIIPVSKQAAEINPKILANIELFKHQGISVLEHLNEKMLTSMIQYLNKMYYNSQPVLTDNQYDIIKEYTDTKFPSNITTTEIGAVIEKNKAQLPYEMASMDKIKPDTGALQEWRQKYKGPYVLSCKLDGVSALYTTEGPVPKLYTRGNGSVGQDVSHLIQHLKLPKTKGIAIRGEFIIPKTVFDTKYKDKFANPRNMVAGIVNHKTINEAIKDVHFVAYEVIMPGGKKSSEQMKFLQVLNVESVLYKIEPTLSNELLSDLAHKYNTRLEKNWIIVQLNDKISIESDLFMVKTILINLIENALKYAGTDENLILFLYRDKQNSKFGTKDTGPGISSDVQPDIFKKFVRVENEETRSQKGTGLGLFIASEFSKLIGGKLKYIDNQPKGAIFEITL